MIRLGARLANVNAGRARGGGGVKRRRGTFHPAATTILVPHFHPQHDLCPAFHRAQPQLITVQRNYFSSLPQEDPERRLRFEDLENLHPKSLKALRRRNIHEMTEIQEKTYEIATTGRDIVGRARTGTGKTLSFLLPGLERILQDPRPDQVNMLVLSPTRELASQIADQAQMLVAGHGNSITSQVVYGGSSKIDDYKRFEKRIPTVLVGTPGRVKDHLMSTTIDGKPLVDKFAQLQVLVLDETDRLLDMGFREEVQDIIDMLPTERQTLLFSATLPKDVRRIVQRAVRPDYETIDCIEDEDPASQTNEMTQQKHIILPASRFLTGTLEILLNLVDNPNNKVIVFFPMTSMVELFATIFSFRLGRRVSELHGRMPQRSRTHVSQRFRSSKSGTLFTSDVSARGVDYPDVTHVVQVSAAVSRETYIHRLGRTGRAGKKGNGILILPEIESSFLKDLDGLEISRHSKWASKVSGQPSKRIMDELGPIAADVRAGRDKRLVEIMHQSYHAMISYYFQRSNKRKVDKESVVETVNFILQDLGIKRLPEISRRWAEKIGCVNVPGLNIRPAKSSLWFGDQDYGTRDRGFHGDKQSAGERRRREKSEESSDPSDGEPDYGAFGRSFVKPQQQSSSRQISRNLDKRRYANEERGTAIPTRPSPWTSPSSSRLKRKDNRNERFNSFKRYESQRGWAIKS